MFSLSKRASFRELKRTGSKTNVLPRSRMFPCDLLGVAKSTYLDIEILLRANAYNCQTALIADLERTHSAETLHCLLALFVWEDSRTATQQIKVIEHALLARFVLRGCQDEICLPATLRERLLTSNSQDDISQDLLEVKDCMLRDLRTNTQFMKTLAACMNRQQ